jgi:hypothetical protein
MFSFLSVGQLNGSRRDSNYEKLWKPPSNRGFLPCTKPTPNYTSKKLTAFLASCEYELVWYLLILIHVYQLLLSHEDIF